MGVFKNLEEARTFFKNDRFATSNGMEIVELGEGYSICRMTAEERHLNTGGTIMGGVLFTLSDFAYAAAANHMHCPTVAMQSDIHFLAAPKDWTLTAFARLVKDGRTTAVYVVDVKDGTGRLVSESTFTGFKK